MFGAQVYVDDQLCYELSEDTMLDKKGLGIFDAPCQEPITGSTVSVVFDGQIVLCDI